MSLTPRALVTMITDATSVLAALTPLIQQQLAGKQTVTDEDVRAALAGKDAALERFDALIAERAIEDTLAAYNPSKEQAVVRRSAR